MVVYTQTKDCKEDWLKLGCDGFEINILEKLEYDDDESKTDYTEELELLKMIWVEQAYRKRCILLLEEALFMSVVGILIQRIELIIIDLGHDG